MRLPSFAGGLALAVSIVAPAAPAAAGEATDALREFFAEGRRIITEAFKRGDPETGMAQARQLIHRSFDVRQAAARVLGREWALRTAAEQHEFVRLFGDIMERAYLSHVTARLNNEDAIRVHYLDEIRTGETAVVDTTVESRAGVIPFRYRMARAVGRWTVRDVAIDGVSIVESYRAQFARVLGRSSYAETMAALRERYAPGVAVASAGTTAGAPASHGLPVVASAVIATPPAVATRVPRPAAAPEAVSRAPGPPAGSLERAAGPDRVIRPVSIPPREVIPASPHRIDALPPVRTRVSNVPRQTSLQAYWVQVGAFQDEARVSDVIAQLGSTPVTIATAPDRLLRLRTGPFPDRAAAASAARALQQRGFRPFVVETR